eukprot:CAMPEP_0115087440 /NCGR_PEP_ID=MMETSP0227-20121206/23288_1 /TAXON_ID=89957 /ORGANISM="Polarella glacialis, Strain CCMP 1383" /LENGTH=473 /DNA_ID=CAMNT_0002477301 /DNA_START=67 /DNA_END=1488 /DNA_ORIENTATION=-
MASVVDKVAPSGLLLKDFRPSHPADCGKNAILSFDRYKACYILSLIGFHQYLLSNPSHNIQLSSFMPYPTVDHGVEMMMGMLLITGWLSSATWKEASWRDHMKKKVSRLIPPYIMALVLTALPLCLRCREWTCFFQYGLECTTLAGFNPALMWWTNNRPLWFLSTILCYHYASPFFLRWIRRLSVKQLFFALVGLYVVRTGLAVATLLSLQAIYGDLETTGRVIHCWTPLQVWVPAMGAILQQLSQKVFVPTCTTKAHVWIATDLMIVIVGALTFSIPAPENEVLSRMIEYKFTGPPLMLLITLMSCDCNSFRFFTSLTAGSRNFFAGLLSVSYTLYLVHWPLDLLFKMAGLFSEDSWDSVVGASSLEVCFAIFLDLVVMDSFTRACIAWLQKSGLQGPDQKTTQAAEKGPDQKTTQAAEMGPEKSDEAAAGEWEDFQGLHATHPEDLAPEFPVGDFPVGNFPVVPGRGAEAA